MPIRVVAGSDGSLSANTAISAGASLLPEAHAWIAYLWTPPFASSGLWQRLRAETATIDDLTAAIEREGLGAVDGEQPPPEPVDMAGAEVVTLDPGRGLGAPGHAVADALAAFARQRSAAVVVVGSRGRSAVREILLGSVARATLHHAHRPVLVVPPSAATRGSA